MTKREKKALKKFMVANEPETFDDAIISVTLFEKLAKDVPIYTEDGRKYFLLNRGQLVSLISDSILADRATR